MIGALIVTHGRLAIELLNAAETIAGENHRMVAVTLGWHDDVETAAATIQKTLDRIKGPEGALILTDMFGGTPTNIATAMLDPGKVEIVTGVNLPMLIKLAEIDDGMSLAEAARRVRDAGQASIHIASDLLAPRKPAAPAQKAP